jgi:hypothetical protein
MSSTHPWRGERGTMFPLLAKSSQKFDLKNMILSYAKGFSMKKKYSNLPDF